MIVGFVIAVSAGLLWFMRGGVLVWILLRAGRQDRVRA